MGLQTINTIQSGINSNYSDRYIKQALANLGQRTGAKGDSIINSSFTLKELLNSTSTNNIVAYYNEDNNIILRDTIDENISIELSYVNTINNISFSLLEYIPCQQLSGAITKLTDTKIIKNTDSYFFISKCINKENLLDNIVCFEFAELSEQLIDGVIIIPKAGYIDYYKVRTNNNELEIVDNAIISIQLTNFSIDDIYDSLLFENTVDKVINTLTTGIQFETKRILNSDDAEPYLNKLKYYTLNYPKYIKTEFNNAIYFVNDSYIGLKKSILFKFIDEVYKNSKNSNYESTNEFIMYFPSDTEIQYIINENTHAIYFSYDIPVYYSNELKNSSFNNNFSSLNNLNNDEKYKHIVASIHSEDKISMFRFLVTYINDDKYIDNIIVSKVQTLPYITTNEQEENIWVLNDVKTSIPATGEDAGNPNIMMLSFTKQDNNSNVQVLHTYDDHEFKEKIEGFYKDYNTVDDSLVDAEFDYDSNLFVNVDNEQSFKFKIKLPNVNKILKLNKHYGKIIKNTLLWTFVDLKYSDTTVVVENINDGTEKSYTLDELVHGVGSGKSSFITVFWQIENNNGNYTWKYIPNYLFDKQSSNTTDLPALDLGSMLGLKDMVSYFLDNLYEPDKYLHSWVVFDPIIGSEKQSGDTTYGDALSNTYYPVIKTDNADYYATEQTSNGGYNNFLNLVPKFLRQSINQDPVIDFDNSLVIGIKDKGYTDTLFSIKDQSVLQVSKLTGSGDFVPNADDNNVYPLFDFREVLTFNQTLLNRLDVVSVGEDKKVYHAYIGNNPTTSPDILTIGTSETNNNMKNSQTLPSGNFAVYDRVCLDMPLNETKDAKFENLIIDQDSNGNYFSIVTIDQNSEFISNITDTIIPATKYMGELTIGRKVFDASAYVSQDIFKHIVLQSSGITCEVINNTDDETTHNEEIIPCGGCSNNSFGYERLSFILYFDKVDNNYAVELKGCEQIISTSNYILGPTIDTNSIDIPLTISLVNDKDKQNAELIISYSSFAAETPSVDGEYPTPLLNLIGENGTLRYSYNPYTNFSSAKILKNDDNVIINTKYDDKNKNLVITEITIKFANNKSIYLLGNGNGFSVNDYITISCNVEHEISGNIESLLKNLDPLNKSKEGRSLMRSSKVVIPNKELPIFPYLFKDNENVIDASKLRLPEDIYDFSYYSMFYGCKKLKYGPKLISKKVAAYCYSDMFNNCSELIDTPELHSSDIAPFCYQSMFEGCSSITKAPDLHFTKVTARCCYKMFKDCKSLLEPAKMKTEYFEQNFNSLYDFIINGKIGDNHFYISDDNGKYIKNGNIYNKTVYKNVIIRPNDINQTCFGGLYMGCEKFKDLSNLHIYITQSDINHDGLKLIGVSNLCAAFSDIFRECTSLIKAPSLSKDKLYYLDMSRAFYYCTSLETISLPGFLTNSSITNNMSEGIYSIYESAFEGCTSLKNITGFNSALMTSYRCYADMFYKCVSLESIPTLTYEISYKGSYAQMFKGCKSLTKAELKFVEMKTTTPIDHFGYSFAYYGSCTNMFEGCENLNNISVEFVNWYNTGDDTDTNLYIDSNSQLLYKRRGNDGNFGDYMHLNSSNQRLTTDLLDSTFTENPNIGTVDTPNYKVKIDGNSTEYSIFNVKLVPTFNWLKDVAKTGKFTCYTELPHDAKNYLNNPNYIPWGKVNIRPDNNDYFYIDIINNDLQGAYYEISLCSTNEDASNDDLPVLDYYAVFNVNDGDKCDKCNYTWSEEEISYWTGSGSGSFTINYDDTDTEGSSGDTSSGAKYGTWDIVEFLFPQDNYSTGTISGTWSGSGWDGIGSFTVELYYDNSNNYWVFINGKWILEETIDGTLNEKLYHFYGTSSGYDLGDWDTSYKNKSTEYTYGYMNAAGTWYTDDDTERGSWSISGNVKGAYVDLSKGYKSEGNSIIVDEWNNLYDFNTGSNEQLSVSSPLKIGTDKVGEQITIYTNSEAYPIKYRTRIYFRNQNSKITKPFNAHFDIKIKDADGIEIKDVNSCHYHIGGNIVTLLKQTKYNEYNDKEIPESAFSQLFNFSNNTNLLTLASGLKLPKIISNKAYYGMFENSTNLIIGPMLPATTLKPNCYQKMFNGCESLKKLASSETNWSLPATNIADYCYNNMFTNCISLPGDLSFLELSANNLAEGCYNHMFNGCTQLTNTPIISCSSNFAKDCFTFMFNNCENLTQIKLNISNLRNIEEFKSNKGNYFYNWVYGVKTTRDTNSISFIYNNEEYAHNETYYNDNYYNDSFIPTSWLPSMPQNYFWIEFDNEPGTIEIQNNQNNIEYYVDVNNLLTYDSDGKVTISDWTPYNETISVTGKYKVYFRYNGATLPGTFGHFNVSNRYSVGGQLATLYSNDNTIINNNEFIGYGDGLFKELFGHSTNSDNNITSAENLILFNNTQTSCYNHMFADCIYLTKTPSLLATELETTCYDSMFENCTSLTEIPDLSEVTKIGQESCQFMFKKCTGLTTFSNLSNITEIKYKGCNEMFSECTLLNDLSEYSLGNDNTALADEACYGMFKKCTGITKAIKLPSVNLQSRCYDNMFEECSSLIYLNVGFTNWSDNAYTNYWVQGVNTEDGEFIGPESLGVNIESNYNVNRIPIYWWKGPEYLTFETTENCSIYLTSKDGSGNLSGGFDPSLQYKIINKDDNSTEGFKDYNFESTIGEYISLSPNQKLMFVSKNTDINNCIFSERGRYFTFNTSYSINKPNITVSGNIYSLVYKDFYNITENTNIIKPYMFSRLFYENSTIKNAKKLKLLSIRLSYSNMDNYTDASSCYSYMFSGCSDLTESPILPAKLLSGSCYEYMFSNCTSLETAPELPSNSIKGYCYNGMFYGCTNLIKAPNITSMNSALNCCSYMFAYCTSLVEVPKLSTPLSSNCYDSMFKGCTRLTTAPELPKPSQTDYQCYYEMFSGCTSLNYIKVNFTKWYNEYSTISYSYSTYGWVKDVAPKGTFVCPTQLTEQYDESHIPVGWTVDKY